MKFEDSLTCCQLPPVTNIRLQTMRVLVPLNDNYIFISRTYMCQYIISTMPIAKIYNLGRTTKQTSMCIFVNGIRQNSNYYVLLLYVQKVESIFLHPRYFMQQLTSLMCHENLK